MATSGVGQHRRSTSPTPRGGWIYEHEAQENPTLTTTPTLPAGSLTVAGVNVTGVVLTTTPTLPAGKLNTNVTGVVLTTTPSLPAGVLNTNVTGVVLTTTPSLPAGGAQKNQITGVALTTTPTLPAGALATSITGVVLTTTPSLPAGSLRTDVRGVVLTSTPSLPAGSLNTSVTGVVLTTTPSLPAGSLTTAVTGVVLTTTPSLPSGTVTLPGASVVGVALETTPTLPAGSLTINSFHTGVVLTTTPTLPAGSLNTSVTGITLTTTPVIPGNYSKTILADTPSGYWRMEDASGNLARSAGTADLLTSGSAQTYGVAGHSGQGITFNGSGRFGTGAGADFAFSSGSIEAWFKTTDVIGGAGGYAGIITKQQAYGMFNRTGTFVSFDWSGGGELSSGISVADGLWHHGVLTWVAGGSRVMYLDGVQVATQGGFNIANQTVDFQVGDGNAAQFFIGTIDEPAVYNYVLTPTQVTQHYNAGTGDAHLTTSLTGVTLTSTPSLPAGALTTAVTGVTLTTTPTLPPGSFTTAVSVTGVALTTTPTLPAGSLSTSLTGIVLTSSPSLPAGALTRTVTGVVLTTTPTMPAGSFTVSQIVIGNVLTTLLTLPAGAVQGGLQPRTDTQARFERGSSNVVVIRPSMTKGQRFTRRP